MGGGEESQRENRSCSSGRRTGRGDSFWKEASSGLPDASWRARRAPTDRSSNSDLQSYQATQRFQSQLSTRETWNVRPHQRSVIRENPEAGAAQAPTTDDWRNEIEHIDTAERDSAIEGNGAASNSSARENPDYTRLNASN